MKQSELCRISIEAYLKKVLGTDERVAIRRSDGNAADLIVFLLKLLMWLIHDFTVQQGYLVKAKRGWWARYIKE